MSAGARSFECGDYLLKEWEPGDEERILAAFNRVFARVDPGFTPRSAAHWRWQYLENPAGKLLISAHAPDGEVVAHHGFIVQRLRLADGETLCGQTVDSFVDPAHRRGLQRTSLSATLSNTFIPHTGGLGPGRHLFYWGAPVRSAMRVGESLGGYEVIRTQLRLSCAPDELRVEAARGVRVEELAQFPEETEPLFDSFSRPYGAIAVRDRAQLSWRYASRPGRDYALACALRGGELVGLVVVTQAPFDGRPDDLLLCEWLVPPGEAAVRGALLAWVSERARGADAPAVTGLFPHHAHPFVELQRHGLRAQPTRYPLTVWPTHRRYDADWLRDRWYYALGDTDLV